MKCKKHGDVGGIGFSVFPKESTKSHGSVMIFGPGENIIDKDECSYYNVFCVQCVGELFEKLGLNGLSDLE